MILTIDIGNTKIFVARFDETNPRENGELKPIKTYRIPTNDNWNINSIEVALLMHWNVMEYGELTGCIISSEVPRLTYMFEDAVYNVTGVHSIIVKNKLNLGYEIEMDNPDKLACDLIVNTACAIKEHTGNMIIVDMGTATAISIVRYEEGKFIYCGTVALPGLIISQKALAENCAQLPEVDLNKLPKEGIRIDSRNTIDSMFAGLIYGHAAMIDGIVDRIIENQGFDREHTTVIATGSPAKIVLPHCRTKNIIFDETLMIKGMYYLYENNH